MSNQHHGFTVHCIYVVRNGDGNVHYQRRGRDYNLIPGKVAESMEKAAKSAEQKLVEFLCKSDKEEAPGHD
jgi:hypothetical protein